MQLVYFDSSDTKLADRVSGTKCASSNDLHKFSIDFGNYGSPYIARVDVKMQQLNSAGDWVTIEKKTYYLGD